MRNLGLLIVSAFIVFFVLWSVHIFRNRYKKRDAPSEMLDDEDIPLFMKTAEGRHYKGKQNIKLQTFRDETLKIETELARTAEELEHTNAKQIDSGKK